MKYVLSPDSVAHAWAHQTQDRARNSGDTFYFDGKTIYSYGRHFPIATHVTNSEGKNTVLFTYRGYSNTTANHINIVRNAVNHLDKLYCHTPDGVSHSANMHEFKRAIQGELNGLARAKKPEKYIQPAEAMLNHAVKYAEFFGMPYPTELFQMVEMAKTGEYAKYLQIEAERIAKENEERKARALAQFKKEITNWRKGKGQRLYNRLLERDYLRFNNDKKRVETSQGVELPEAIAKRAFKWIESKIKSGGCDGTCAYKILDFEVNEVNKDFVKIGCHVIDLKEIRTFAKKMNW